jgi:hypothetical protein
MGKSARIVLLVTAVLAVVLALSASIAMADEMGPGVTTPIATHT